MITLYPHQEQSLKETEHLNRVAYYHDMGLGKTFTGAEKMHRLGAKVNLVICQKSKIEDWVEHFYKYYLHVSDRAQLQIFDLTDKGQFNQFLILTTFSDKVPPCVGIINYELAFRRPQLMLLRDFTLMLDESSMIQNETAKRSKFILKLKPANVILLSGTPTGGKYEKLWSQCKLLGWDISKKLYWATYIDTEVIDGQGFPITIVKGYKNVERLKNKLREHGAVFMKSDEVFDLPPQIDQKIKLPATKEYRKFRKSGIVTVAPDGLELVGDTTLTKMLYERQLCGQYNSDKLRAFEDLLESTSDRLIVFYSFTEERRLLTALCNDYERPVSIVSGDIKALGNYERFNNSVTLIQYQAGAMGLNLQLANKVVYFTPPLSSELFEQSKKRIHRIKQERPCFYYYLTVAGSVEEKIYKTLALRKDYTEKLFEEG